MLHVLLADGIDPISGGAGWIGAGLLGLVLGWLLLKHLPDKDKQLKDLLDSRDKLMSEQLTLERQSCEKRHAENMTESRLQREEIAKTTASLMPWHLKELDGQKEIRHAIYDLTQQIANWTAVARALIGKEIDLPDIRQKTYADEVASA